MDTPMMSCCNHEIRVKRSGVFNESRMIFAAYMEADWAAIFVPKVLHRKNHSKGFPLYFSDYSSVKYRGEATILGGHSCVPRRRPS